MTHLQGNWITFWLAYLVTLCIGVTLAYLFAAVSPTLSIANAALPCYVVTLLFFTGAKRLSNVVMLQIGSAWTPRPSCFSLWSRMIREDHPKHEETTLTRP